MGDLISTKTASIKRTLIKSKRIFSENKKKKIKTQLKIKLNLNLKIKHKEVRIQIFCN